jgi:hypothetical protein
VPDLAGVEKVCQQRSRIAQRLNVRQRVRFASSLAAAFLDGYFDRPAGFSDGICGLLQGCIPGVSKLFFNSLLEGD